MTNYNLTIKPVYKSRYSTIIFILILTVLTSCKENSTDSSDFIGGGSFTAEISGSINQEISGVAIFGTQLIDGPTGNIFVLTMSTINTEINYVIGVTYLSSSRPGIGSRTIDNDGTQSEGYFVVNHGNEEFDYYNPQSGELTITSSSSQSLQGQLSLNAVLPSNGNEVTINASFNASCQSSQTVTCD